MIDAAIIGMACVLPGAPDLETFWHNVTNGVDAISEAPPWRVDPAFYDPEATTSDRLYCKRGGFVDAYARFDAARHGVMPSATRGGEPDQFLTLEVATRALADAGYQERPFPRARTGVLIGRGNYPGTGHTLFEQRMRSAEQIVAVLQDLLPDLPPERLARVKEEFQAAVPAAAADAAIGLVPNLTASRIANRLDLQGPAFTIDAACASALVAVDQACAELTTGRCDLAIAGGVHLCHEETFWSVFCQLGALSRRQQIRPFDRRADGILIGEGVGIVVVKRRADAERDGDRIYAVIRGTGVSSDGRDASLMKPRVEGQVLALERAWRSAGLDPATIGLVEAHGTGTPAGDTAELETLHRFFGPPSGTRAGLGSVKSMIGHAMPAAGAAGLIKAALAAHHGVLPPTLNCEEPHPAIEGTRFRLVTQPEEWGASERRAAVNAFGFGGINAHVVIDGVPPRRRAARQARHADDRLLAVAAESRDALLAALPEAPSELPGATGTGRCRLVVLGPTRDRLARARTIVANGRRWTGHDGIWFTPAGLLHDGRLAFVFPGVDAAFRPRVEDLAARFGIPMPHGIDSAGAEALPLALTGSGIVGVNRLVDRALRSCGVVPDVLIGHSIGEWSAMIAAGMIAEPVVDEIIAAAREGVLVAPDVVFAAAGCSVETVLAAMDGLPRISLSHDNCPHQVVICGVERSIDVAMGRLREQGVLAQKLPFRSGFHTPLFATHIAPHRERFARMPLSPQRLPVWSATSCAEYPADLEKVRALAIEHLVSPVRFRELVEALYESGVRVFVQAGTGSLVQFVEDTLRGRPHAAISANVHDRSGMAQLRRTVAAIWAEGGRVDLPRLWPRRADVPLSLGAPLVRLGTPLPTSVVRPQSRPVAAGPLADAFTSTLDAMARAQEAVLARMQAQPSEATIVRRLSLSAFPELRDHTFFRQPEGWAVIADRHPVVPMTGLIALMIEEASKLMPGRVAVAVERVRAFRWLVVSSPVEGRIRLSRTGDCVAVQIEGYAEGTVRFADQYPHQPAEAAEPLADVRPAPCSAEAFYTDRWMFHGPAYRGVVSLDAVGSNGIRGSIETRPALGALLDNAGQLFGFWIMLHFTVDRMAMPVALGRVSFYGPHPAVGERIDCTAVIRREDPRSVVADLTLSRAGRVWCRIEDWEDRRFETDARLWEVLRFPERNLLSEPRSGGWCWFADRYRAAPSRDQLARRFLGEAERRVLDAQPPRVQRAWLSGRIAIKDAVRDLLWREGRGSMFPAEVEVADAPDGRPRATVAGADLRVSLSQAGDVSAAIAATEREVGIHVERIEPDDASFAAAFDEAELALLPTGDREEWLARLWAARQVAAEVRGSALEGSRRRVCGRGGERLLVDGLWVDTCREGAHVVAWTVEP